MKKVNVKRLKIEILVFTILALFSSSILIDQMAKKHKDMFEVKKTEYKFYIKDSDTGKYEEQTSNVFPGEGYYLNIDKTNEECSTGEVDQNDDLSIQALIRFSTLCDLYYDPNGILTVTANVPTAIATIKKGDDVIATGTVPISAGIGKGKNVTITVSDPEYYYTKTGNTYNDYEETFEMPGTNTTKDITLNERPWITGTIANSSNTTAKTKTDTNWHPGYYLVEVWGGKGGAYEDSGASGYVYGVVYIDYEGSVYSTAGGNGSSGTSRPVGGANGGAAGGSSTSGLSGIRGGGGGYSAFAVGATAISQTTINNGSVKILAGGGGGGSAKGGTLGNSAGGAGGAGGNMSSTVSSITAGKVFSGSNGSSNGNSANTPGKGGSTSAGGAGSGASAGSLLNGGAGYERGGGGGAGYYGGGGGGVSSLFATAPGGGGGGSSFIANGVTYSNLPSSVTSKLTSTNPSSTGGAIKIQWIGKNMP